jgi:pimeloyl-ACP methyl ester carboxylesterase
MQRVKRVLWSTVSLALLLLSVLALRLFHTGTVAAQSSDDKVIYLDQGWSKADRETYYHISQGSEAAEVLKDMKYMVGNPANIQMAWQIIRPCRAPQAAGIERTAMENTPLKEWWAPSGKMRYLVVQGTDDQIAPPENGELLKQELGARVTLVSFPGAGHLFIVTEAEKTAAAMISFLR